MERRFSSLVALSRIRRTDFHNDAVDHGRASRRFSGRPKFRLRIATLGTSVAELMESLLSIVEVIQDLPIEPIVERDPDDDKILACATAGRAEWIVSGDDDL